MIQNVQNPKGPYGLMFRLLTECFGFHRVIRGRNRSILQGRNESSESRANPSDWLELGVILHLLPWTGPLSRKISAQTLHTADQRREIDHAKVKSQRSDFSNFI